MIFFVLWVCFFSYSWGQRNSYTVIAESGDGIYSILRKQGVDPVKYYQAFIELNEENIKDGSFMMSDDELIWWESIQVYNY